MNEKERTETIDLLVFISGRPDVFYTKMSDEQLQKEYERLSSPKN